MNERPKVFTLARHVVSLLVALLFGMSAVMKFFEMPIQVHRFEQWGYPSWFMYLIGVLEIIAAFLLVFVPTRIVGAGLGLSVLVGAACTHIVHGQWGDMMGTATTACVLLGVVWLHWETDS